MGLSTKRTNSGVLTLAIGPRYRRMARRLAWSLDVHAPGLPRAVITDVPTHALSRCFEHVIEFRPGASGVFGEKVRLDSYSPFT